MSIQVTMTGGSPWGFKMTGGKDFHLPLAIGKVKSGGKASRSGVVEGYLIEKVNGEEFTNLSHHEAQNKIKSAGFTLTLLLSKPKPRDVPPANTITTVPTNNNTSKPAPVQYKPKQYENPANQQNGGGMSQSPAYYARTQPAKASLASGDQQTLTITSDIKEMIEEEEKEVQKKYEPGVRRASDIKTWPDPSATNTVSKGAASPQQNKNQAAVNIGKFFQGSAAPKYGEPTFAKVLQDIAGPLGDPAVLEIRLGPNLPVPTVHWYHNNRPARESKEKDIRFLSNGPVHTVVLGELAPELLGTYTCTIMSKNGSKSCRCTVSVSNDGPKATPHNVYTPPGQPSTTTENRRVVPSTSLGLYSNKNAQMTYQGQMNRKSSRDSNEESEVMKALREDSPPKQTPQTRSMKYLEDSLLPESEDL